MKNTVNNGTPCSKCEEFVYYDMIKMQMLNSKNGRRHWCPFGDPPKTTKCRECGADMIFNQLYYDDFKGIFIPLNRDMTAHKCRNEKRKKEEMNGKMVVR